MIIEPETNRARNSAPRSFTAEDAEEIWDSGLRIGDFCRCYRQARHATNWFQILNRNSQIPNFLCVLEACPELVEGSSAVNGPLPPVLLATSCLKLETGRMRAVAIIPARLASTRLPRKPMRLIAGRPMIEHVYRAARRCSLLAEVVVATDSDEIHAFCRQQGFPAILTSAQCRSGTDRVHEAAQKIAADVYVNVQGDEPLTRPEHITVLLETMREGVLVGTLKTPMTGEAAQNPNVVKVTANRDGRALYFSRASIPFDRDRQGVRYYKHLGFYAYRRAALEQFVGWPEAELERAERLEQLRFLENGVDIYVGETPFDTVGVDTEDDLRQVEELILAQNLSR